MTDFCIPELDTTTLAEEGVAVALKTLAGAPLLNAKKDAVGLILYGADSSQYRKAARKQARSAMARAKARKDEAEVTDEALDQAEADSLAVIVACTKGWFGVLDSKGKAIPFTPEGCAEFYRRFPPAKEQADAAIVDRARFMKASSGGSSNMPDGGLASSEQRVTETA